jgi:hypothetical protein
MIKSIKSMNNVKALTSKEIQNVRGGGPGSCSASQPCPYPYCCNLLTLQCEIGGPYGGCWNF